MNQKHTTVSILVFIFALSWSALSSARTSCHPLFEKLLEDVKAAQKSRASLDEVAPELKSIVTEIVRSGTRTQEQHKKLADAVVKYLKKYGVKTRTESPNGDGIDIIVEDVKPDSPFTWAKRVPDRLHERFNFKLLGLFNTDHILNPYTPGVKGGSAQFRRHFYEKKGALVFSAKALMSQQFHAASDGHEAIHARTNGDTTPQIAVFSFKSKLAGKVGADLYGREFSTDEIHSAYPFSVRNALRDIEPGKPPLEEPKGAFSEVEMTILRNEILQGLFETIQSAYEEAIKPGTIKASDISEIGTWSGDRAISVKTADNQVNFFFRSEQVNQWKLAQDPTASKKKDWSKDVRTVRAMFERDYLASKRAATESEWLVRNLTGPNPRFNSFREATRRVSQLRDFTTVGDTKASRAEREAAAERIVEAGRGERELSEKDKKRLVKEVLKLRGEEGVLAVPQRSGSAVSIDASQPTEEAPAVKLLRVLGE